MTTEMQINNVAEIQLMYSAKYKVSEMPKICSSFDAFKVLQNFWPVQRIEYQEDFFFLILNRANKVIGICNLSTGGTSATVVDLKIMFAVALKAGAGALIMAHNHPTGEFEPSNADIQLTNRAVEVGKFLDMPVLDHVIISKYGYYSMADQGRM